VAPEAPPSEHFDVLIVGAGLSGIDAAYRLQTSLPHKTYAIFEAREAIGGTWDLFRYPGIRSDSDMYTLGFPFRPWHSNRSIVDGPSIRQYIVDTACEYGIDRKIRFRHRVTRADWSSADQQWLVEANRADTGETFIVTCSFLLMCSGYYRYDEGYMPAYPNAERFTGPIVHPQFWPAGLDYEDKRVIVIGSGATAVTLVPALAEKAAHVTMLQRSPSYVLSVPEEDSLAKAARHVLPPKRAHALIRWKNALLMVLLFQVSRRRPEFMKRLLRRGIERLLGPDYDIDTHFTPRYNPWEQRMCFVRGGDLFEAINQGHEIVTDEIDSFTEGGIRLASGRQLDADIVVSATGLNLLLFGAVDFMLDGQDLDMADRLVYRGCMLSDIPNMAFTFGYVNASWTLRCDLTWRYVSRLLAHMDEHGYGVSTPRNQDPSVTRHAFADFSSGYFLRALDRLPKQGSKPPWRLHQNYLLDTFMLKALPIDEPSMEFTPGGHKAARAVADSRLAAAA
jgi:cation diffusion facilitator CzcD-associated flavoprotein CzcO